MRLAQLARKLSVRPSEIVDLLSKEQIFFEDGSNAKMSDEQVKQVVLHFAPERLSEIMLVQTTEVNEPEPQLENALEASIEMTDVEIQPVSEVLNSAVETDLPETIRAQKVELAGLKVLGKIDLPQPRLKETKEETKFEGDAKPKRERLERKPKRNREDAWRNPVAQQREAEAREREARKQEALKQEKERKRLHYLNQVKNNKPPKAARIYDEQPPATKQVQKERPRTLLGKFLYWLNN